MRCKRFNQSTRRLLYVIGTLGGIVLPMYAAALAVLGVYAAVDPEEMHHSFFWVNIALLLLAIAVLVTWAMIASLPLVKRWKSYH